MITKLKHYSKRLFYLIKYKIRERTYNKRLKYMFYTSKEDTDKLLIVFSGFPSGNVRLYNYVNGFTGLPVDRLYISDTFGYRGSYYLYENGEDYPFELTKGLIAKVLQSGRYKHVYTAGTSKGGSCAVIFGLLFSVDAIFAGACQYHLGSYLNNPSHFRILEKMMRKGDHDVNSFVKQLDEFIPSIIKANAHSISTVHLVYSKQEKEKTYQRHIVDLIEEFKRNQIKLVEHECVFKKHDDCGYSFIPYVRDYFCRTKLSSILI